MKVLALSGWKKSGKDTAAEYLVKEYGFVRFGFADVLKDMVAEQYDIPREHCDDPAYKEKAITTLPVNPQDEFSKMIASFMYKEFRDLEGNIPEGPDNLAGSYWTPRALCILEGSVKRSANSSYWVQRVISKIKKLNSTEAKISGVVISDLRYKSEVAQLKEAFKDVREDLIPIRINRFETSPSTDPSERDLDDYEFDITIDNVNGSIYNLYKNLDQIMMLENVNKAVKN